MKTGNLGQIMALLGLILFLVTGWGRRQIRKQGRSASPRLLALQSWGSLAALLLILAGLVLMYYQK